MKILYLLNRNDDEVSDLGGIRYMSIPDSSMRRNDNPVFIPNHDSEIKGVPVFAIRIERLGKTIAKRFSHRYYSEVSFGLVLYKSSQLHNLQELQLPWTEAFAFDSALSLGKMVSKEHITGEKVLQLNIGEKQIRPMFDSRLYEKIDRAIEYISRYNTLKIGDIIVAFLGQERMEIRPDMNISISYGLEEILSLNIK